MQDRRRPVSLGPGLGNQSPMAIFGSLVIPVPHLYQQTHRSQKRQDPELAARGPACCPSVKEVSATYRLALDPRAAQSRAEGSTR